MGGSLGRCENLGIQREEFLAVCVFLQPEWANFVRVARNRPWQWIGYALGLWRLVFRRLANTLRLKLLGKSQRGLKHWPYWLGSRDIGDVVCRQGGLSFPKYSLASQACLAGTVPNLHFEANDAESYFSSHRWGSCFVAALESGDVAEAAIDEVLSWIRSAPAKHDAAWETYSSCERVVNLTVMLAAHPDNWRNLDAGKKTEIANFIVESASWINRHLEYYGIGRTNNHILNNARALVIAGSVLGDEAVVERGLILFARMAKELFQPGGFLRERSSHYQCIVTNWLMDTLHFARSVPIGHAQASVAMRELEELSVTATAATGLLVAAIEGLNTHIGDISPDNHPVAATLRLQALYPSFFPRVEVASDGYQDDWLFVSSGKSQLLTCGMPVEYPFDYATHGHSDLGSFVWGYNRHPILVDAGRSSYVSDETTRAQCGYIGHNVLAVNGLSPLSESLLRNGNWRPRPYAKAEITLKHKSANGFVLAHDGFSRIPGVKIHTRTVQITSDGIEVLDTLEGSGMVEIDIYWHFAPGVSLLPGSPNIAIAADFQILIEEDGADISHVQCEAYPYAAAYGDVQKAYMLHSRRSVSLPWSVKTIMKVSQCAG